MPSHDDPRRLNCQFDLETIEAHVKGYADALSRALLSIDWHQLDLAIAEIESARTRGARLWVAGNGGSAAIADHLLCDWVKGTFIAFAGAHSRSFARIQYRLAHGLRQRLWL